MFRNVLTNVCLIIGCLALSSCHEKNIPDGEVILQGEIMGLEDESLILYSLNYETGVRSYESKIIVKNDKFKVQFAPSKGFGLYFLSIENFEENIKPLFLENGVISIKGGIDDFRNMKVEGSYEQDLADKYFMDSNMKFGNEMRYLNENFEKFMAWGDSANISKTFLEIESLNAEMQSFTVQFIQDNSESYFSLHILFEQILNGKNNSDLFLELFSSLAPKIQNSNLGVWIKEEYEERVEFNNASVIKDFILPQANSEGEMEQVNFSSIYEKNDYTLVYFWSTFCQECLYNNIYLNPLLEKYGDRGFGIFALSLDFDIERWTKVSREQNYLWPNICDGKSWNSKIAGLYKVRFLPQNYLVNNQGTILYRDVDISLLDSIIASDLIKL